MTATDTYTWFAWRSGEQVDRARGSPTPRPAEKRPKRVYRGRRIAARAAPLGRLTFTDISLLKLVTQTRVCMLRLSLASEGEPAVLSQLIRPDELLCVGCGESSWTAAPPPPSTVRMHAKQHASDVAAIVHRKAPHERTSAAGLSAPPHSSPHECVSWVREANLL